MEMFGDEFEICPHCGYIVGTPAEEAIHMEPGTLLYDRYIIGKVLGYGGFGVTYIAWDGKLQQKVAIKEYLPGEFSTRMPGQSQVTVFNGEKSEQFQDGLSKFVEEAKRLAKFQNEPGIVKIFDSFEENSTAYIVMEYLEGETLTEYLKREKTIPEDRAVEMMTPIMESLQVVHSAGLLHRDIAPDNIFLLKNGEVKLIDFGASRYATTSHSRSLTVIIKPGYSPEEQYRSRGDQGPHTDVYALAATLYKMITGKTPPDAMERRAKYENQNKDILEEPHKIEKSISLNREVAILNAMNVRIEDRTPDVGVFMQELNADPPAKRVYGKIKKLDLYSMPLWLKIAVPALLACIGVFVTLLLTGVISFSLFSEEIIVPDGIVTVPDVEGEQKDTAVKLIEDSQLLATTGGTIESEYIPAGKIILQDPVGGSYMDVNAMVVLTVSEGKGVEVAKDGVSTVPYVIWNTKAEAIEKLKQAGLAAPEIKEEYNDTVALGQVISQSVKAGEKVKEGTKITLTVSKGAKATKMPNVVGKSYSEAEKLLKKDGLAVSVEYKKDTSAKENTVLEQSVKSGASVKRGDKVTLTVASPKSTVDVKNVKGMSRGDAVSVLQGQGFKVTVLENYDSNVAKGSVISQSPAAGSSQLEGATITLYVSKGRQTVSVSFSGNGGKASSSGKTVYAGGTYGDLPSASKSGEQFLGWYTAASGGSRVVSSTVVSTKSDHTLYAHYSKNVVKVSFNANGGKCAQSSISVSPGGTYGTLPTPTKAGSTFQGWYTASSGGTRVTGSSTVSSKSNHTLYAHWKLATVTVYFNSDGATVGNKNVSYGSKYGILPSVKKTGSSFEGWYTAASGGSLVTEDTAMKKTSDHILYAHWSSGTYKIIFDAAGGTVSQTSVLRNYGDRFGSLPTATRPYYTFKGWYTADGVKAETTSVMKAEDLKLYAHWEEKSLSDWVLSSNVPSGAKVEDRKWTYTKTETTTSDSASLSGWTQTGSSWQKSGSGTYYYANFPTGYNTTDERYVNYGKAQLSRSSESATGKREAGTPVCNGYIYWHWVNPSTGAVSTSYDAGSTSTWGVFSSKKEFSTENGLYVYSQGADSYSKYWYRLSVFYQEYTDYKKVYSFRRTTTGESTVKVSGAEYSDVKEYVRYREK